MAFLNCGCSRCGRIDPYEEPSATYVEGMLFDRARRDGWQFNGDRNTLCPRCAGKLDHEALRSRAGKGDDT